MEAARQAEVAAVIDGWTAPVLTPEQVREELDDILRDVGGSWQPQPETQSSAAPQFVNFKVASVPPSKLNTFLASIGSLTTGQWIVLAIVAAVVLGIVCFLLFHGDSRASAIHAAPSKAIYDCVTSHNMTACTVFDSATQNHYIIVASSDGVAIMFDEKGM